MGIAEKNNAQLYQHNGLTPRYVTYQGVAKANYITFSMVTMGYKQLQVNLTGMMLNRVTIDTVMMSRDHAIKEPKSSQPDYEGITTDYKPDCDVMNANPAYHATSQLSQLYD